MPSTLQEFQKQTAAEIGAAKAARQALLSVKGARTTANTLLPYDEIQFRLGRAQNTASAFEDLHPDAAWRAAAAKVISEIASLRADLSLDRGVYDAIAGVSDVPEDAKWYVRQTLANAKRDGVLLPEESRKRVAELRRELSRLQQQYSANLAANRREIRVRAADLDSMPADFMKSHPMSADGTVSIRNDAAEADAVSTYAQNAAVRKQVSQLVLNRGYPENQQVVTDLIRTRHQLATLVGFPTFADFQMDSRMVGSVQRQRDFLRAIERASEAGAQREFAELLAYKRKDDPQAERLEAHDLSYYERLVRESKFKYDVRQAREYMPYTTVKEAVLGTAAALFALEFKQVKGVTAWHPSVEAYEVLDHGKLIGRFYLDMHPRANKYQHFAASVLRAGSAGKELPEALLLCNFPDPANGPALVEPDRARTFFHEFGHLLHSIFRGQGRWVGAMRPEADFMEAPSQLLEEWLESPELLVRFTKHYKTGEQMPLSMARTLIEARSFGKARRARASVALSWSFLDMQDDAEPVTDPGPVYKSHYERLGVPVPAGHIESSISHMGLPNYGAAYYTYLWSQVIAKDLFTRFDRKDLLATRIAREYRQKVLEPGGRKPAATFVQDFLGRPFNEKAYQAWLSR